ncbi:hypothetical protein EVAR_17938_1 [Eumeta japonica]|uniref:FLYWCH-type domain-containing protein n=1 Tax=Eumeta variegata TaxID=151549 RepID=A0A4C1UYZ0_EUMVA|nr:hypothetical protein EVAR_17938_1 [Eumeta japonica]
MYIFDDGHTAAWFGLSSRGNEVLNYGGYRYHRASGPRNASQKLRWICIKQKHLPVFTLSRFGKPVIQMGKYRFNKYCKSKGPKARWTCVRIAQGCGATITTLEEMIVKMNNNHNHI